MAAPASMGFGSPAWGSGPSSDYGEAAAGGGIKVVETVLPEAGLNTASAEHRKQVVAGPESATFSSPFGFSQGEASCVNHQVVVHPPTVLQVTVPTYAEQVPAHGPVACGAPPVQSQQYGYTYQIQMAPPYPQPCPGPQPAPAGPPVHILEGWLAKRGHDFGRSWLDRWFVLHSDGVLTYGKVERGPETKRIPLDAATEVRPFGHPAASPEGRAMKAKKPCGFEVYQGPGKRTWYLDPGCIEKRDHWVRALNDLIMVRFRAPPGPPHAGTPGWTPPGVYA